MGRIFYILSVTTTTFFGLVWHYATEPFYFRLACGEHGALLFTHFWAHRKIFLGATIFLPKKKEYVLTVSVKPNHSPWSIGFAKHK